MQVFVAHLVRVTDYLFQSSMKLQLAGFTQNGPPGALNQECQLEPKHAFPHIRLLRKLLVHLSHLLI